MSEETSANEGISTTSEAENVEQQDSDSIEQSKQVQNLKKKFKLKVDGEEFEEEVDLADEEGLKRHLQLSKAAQKRMKEASDSRRQAEQVLKMIKENPVDAITKLGGNFRELAEQYLLKQIEEETLTPEQKKLKQAEEILRQHELGQKEAKEKEETERISQLENHYAAQAEKTIAEALKESNLPKTPVTVRRMAQLMHQNISMGLELEPKQLAQMVRESYITEINELFGNTEGDVLLELLGDGVANKIRKKDIERLKQKNNFNNSHKVNTPTDEAPKYMNRDEWREHIRNRAKD